MGWPTEFVDYWERQFAEIDVEIDPLEVQFWRGLEEDYWAAVSTCRRWLGDMAEARGAGAVTEMLRVSDVSRLEQAVSELRGLNRGLELRFRAIVRGREER